LDDDDAEQDVPSSAVRLLLLLLLQFSVVGAEDTAAAAEAKRVAVSGSSTSSQPRTTTEEGGRLETDEPTIVMVVFAFWFVGTMRNGSEKRIQTKMTMTPERRSTHLDLLSSDRPSSLHKFTKHQAVSSCLLYYIR